VLIVDGCIGGRADRCEATLEPRERRSHAGILVPQRDPDAIRAALHRVLTEPGLAAGMAARSRALAPALLWPAVADQYIALGRMLLAAQKRSVA